MNNISDDDDVDDEALKKPHHYFSLSLVLHLIDSLDVPDPVVVFDGVVQRLKNIMNKKATLWGCKAIYIGGFSYLKASVIRHIFVYLKSNGMSGNGIGLKFGTSSSIVLRGIKQVARGD